jgi:transposase InsO family protein
MNRRYSFTLERIASAFCGDAFWLRFWNAHAFEAPRRLQRNGKSDERQDTRREHGGGKVGLVVHSTVTSAAGLAQPLQAGEQTANSAPSLLRPEGWHLTADGKLGAGSGAPVSVKGLNGNEAEQTKAGLQFRRLIDPIINPDRYPDLHSRFQRKSDLLEHIARENGIHPRTLRRKLERWEEKAINGLTRKIRGDKGIPRALNAAGRELIISSFLPKARSHGELSVRDIFREYEEERRWRANQAGKLLCATDRVRYARYVGADGRLLSSAQLPKASYPTFCRQVAQIPELIKTMARQGEKAYRNGELISYRDLAHVQPLDYVVMDHRVLDIFCLIPERRGWKLARPWLTAAIDMRTRKWLAWCLVETPSSDSIAAVLKQVFMSFGLPRSVYWDNGKDFRCQWLEGRKEQSVSANAIGGLPEKWTGVLESLGIRVHHAIVKNARAKIIEPNFINIANFDRTLPEWCGHKPGARPERFDGLVREHEAWLSGERDSTPFRTIEEVARLYTDAIEDLNERPHQGEGMRKWLPQGMGWLCPNEAWELLIPHVPRRSVPEAIVQLCFAKRRELTIRNGEVHAMFGGRQYHYRFEGNRLRLLALNGRKVELAYDPLDLGAAAVYYSDEFIGLARCIELRRMGEDAFVEDERDRRAARREVRRYIAAVHQVVPVPDAEMHLARRRAVAPARPDPERPEAIVSLPKAIADAHAAQEAERAVSFEDAKPVEVIKRPEPSDDDGTFNFFQTGGLTE